MKKMVAVQEVEDEGLEALFGETVTLYCDTYIYTGKLVGVNNTCVLLENAGIVYATGDYKTKNWSDVQYFPTSKWYVNTSKIESFGILK